MLSQLFRPLLCISLLAMLIPCGALRSQIGVWTRQDSVPNLNYRSIDCADTLHCMAFGNQIGTTPIIRSTTDGGGTWRTVYLDSIRFLNPGYHLTLRINAGALPTPTHAVVACDSGVVMLSDDGGGSWRRTSTGTTSRVTALDMVDSLVGLAVAAPKTLLRTTDGGASWRPVALPSGTNIAGLADLHCLSRDLYVISAFSDTAATLLLRSADAGATWSVTSFPRNCGNLAFTGYLNGWTVGGERTGNGDEALDIVHHTTDGGATWRNQVRAWLYVPAGLNTLAAYDSLHAIAVGQVGKILRTVDGGERWVQDESALYVPGVPQFNCISYPTATFAMAATNNGNIVRFHGTAPADVAPEHRTSGAGLSVVPNPAGPADHPAITVNAPPRARVLVRIVDPTGRVVRVGACGEIESGVYRCTDLGDIASQRGLYFVQALVNGLPAGVRPLVVR